MNNDVKPTAENLQVGFVFWLGRIKWQIVAQEGRTFHLVKEGTKGTKRYVLNAERSEVSEVLSGGCRYSAPVAEGRIMLPQTGVWGG